MNKVVFFSFGALLLLGCGNHQRRVGGSNNVGTVDTLSAIIAKPKIKPNVNVYIENSGSMDGYVNGNTEFKGAIRDLLVLLKHYYGTEEKIKVHFIN